MKKWFLGFWCLSVSVSANVPGGFESFAKQAIVMDAETGTIVYEKNAHELMAPSSMTKIMTAYMLFDKIKNKHLSLDEQFEVSEKAWRTKGSRMFLELHSKASVDDLLHGILVVSGNDACVTAAEGVYGSEEAAADAINAKGKEMGMKNTHFENVTGMPNPEHNTTAYDLAVAARRTMVDFPEYFHYFSIPEYTWNKIKQPNLNPFLELKGGDCCKTGFTDRGGYGVTGSVKRGNTRFVMVINGLKSMKERRAEAARIAEWAFREYKTAVVAKPGQVLEVADVWLGQKPKAALTVREPLMLTVAKHTTLKAELKYNGPLQAPVKAGTQVGTVSIQMADGAVIEKPVYVAENVEGLKGFDKIKAAFRHILYGPEHPRTGIK